MMGGDFTHQVFGRRAHNNTVDNLGFRGLTDANTIWNVPKPSTDERILIATASAIDKHGEAGVRIHDICNSLKITAPSVYHFFGDREGLIEATQAYRYTRGQDEFIQWFAEGVYGCENKADFVQFIHAAIHLLLSKSRRDFRQARAEVLGSAQYRPSLAKKVADAQDRSNRAQVEVLRYARAKGWIKDDFDLLAFSAWTSGQAVSKRLVELEGGKTDVSAWDAIVTRAICLMLGVPEPKVAVRKRAKTTKK
jgi:AcrR family transcriptional regulator